MMQDRNAIATLLAEIAAEAGLFLAGIGDRSRGQLAKPDGSPSTAADLEAERMILDRLAVAFPGIPVIAEETACERACGTGTFFLVDPLDGTRDFLSGSGEYSVNVALIEGARPIAAALAVPPLGRVWAAGTTARSAPLGEAAQNAAWRQERGRALPAAGPTALVSRRHGDGETERCLEEIGVVHRLTTSSAAKFALLACGEADLYVRCGPTMEWDIAAGDHILTCAGGAVVGTDGSPPAYGRHDRGYRNGPFAAAADPRLAHRIALPALC